MECLKTVTQWKLVINKCWSIYQAWAKKTLKPDFIFSSSTFLLQTKSLLTSLRMMRPQSWTGLISTFLNNRPHCIIASICCGLHQEQGWPPCFRTSKHDVLQYPTSARGFCWSQKYWRADFKNRFQWSITMLQWNKAL